MNDDCGETRRLDKKTCGFGDPRALRLASYHIESRLRPEAGFNWIEDAKLM